MVATMITHTAPAIVDLRTAAVAAEVLEEVTMLKKKSALKLLKKNVRILKKCLCVCIFK